MPRSLDHGYRSFQSKIMDSNSSSSLTDQNLFFINLLSQNFLFVNQIRYQMGYERKHLAVINVARIEVLHVLNLTKKLKPFHK